jgi:hypothetical protein
MSPGREEATMDVEGVLRRIAEETANELEEFCALHGVVHANEMRHLAPCCKVIVGRVADALTLRPALAPFGFGERHGWRGLGLVDAVLRWPDETATFIELKCGSGDESLKPCVWDAVKLATGVLGGNAAAGYLLAGAPASKWQVAVAGANLFKAAEWETLGPGVRDDFISDWRKWEREGHIPGRVPSVFRTAPLGLYELTVGGAPWELRLARVEPVGRTWVDWPSTLDGV